MELLMSEERFNKAKHWFENLREEIINVIQSIDGKEFRRQWKLAADQGAYLDRTLLDNIHYKLNVALKAAQREAEAQLSDYDDIKEKQFINYEVDRATRLGDVQRILELQQN